MTRLTASELVERARAEVEHISAEQARALLDSAQHVFVDVRERHEREEGAIPNSVHATRGNLEFYIDPQSTMHIPALAGGKTYIFVCGSGGRAALAAKLAKDFGLKSVCMTGGMRAWRAAGAPVA
jgi:rhodanese-related sulfurtransferase